MTAALSSPLDMTVRYPWQHPKALWVGDFIENDYALSYEQVALADLVQCTRASAHLLRGTDGIFRSFAANELARVDGVGTFIGQQVTNLLSVSEGPSAFNILVNCTTGASAAVGPVNGAAFYATLTSTANGGRGQANVPIPADTVTRYGYCAVRKTAFENTASFRLTIGARQSRLDFSTKTGTASVNSQSFAPVDCGDYWIIGGYVTNDGAGVTLSFSIYPSVGATAVIEVGGCWCYTGAPGAPYVPGAATRLASDVRAASFDWFNSAGLVSAFSMLAVVTLSHLGDNATRWIGQVTGGTTANRAGLFISASDRLNLYSMVGGVAVMNFQLASAVPLGRLAVAATFDPANGWYLKSSSGEFASRAAGGSLPAAPTTLYVGGQAGSVLLNDNLEQLQICRPLSQAECNAWVAAA